jgi:hypothetical protein
MEQIPLILITRSCRRGLKKVICGHNIDPILPNYLINSMGCYPKHKQICTECSSAAISNVITRIQRVKNSFAVRGEDPIETFVSAGYPGNMNLLLVLLVLLVLFGGGGLYFGGPIIGGSGIGLILLICLIIYVMGGFRGSKS